MRGLITVISAIIAIIALFSISANAVEITKDELSQGYIIGYCIQDGAMMCSNNFSTVPVLDYAEQRYPDHELVSIGLTAGTAITKYYTFKLKPKEQK